MIDRPDLKEPVAGSDSPEDHSCYVEHILQLLSTIVGREPLEAAVHGIHSSRARIPGLAL